MPSRTGTEFCGPGECWFSVARPSSRRPPYELRGAARELGVSGVEGVDVDTITFGQQIVASRARTHYKASGSTDRIWELGGLATAIVSPINLDENRNAPFVVNALLHHRRAAALSRPFVCCTARPHRVASPSVMS